MSSIIKVDTIQDQDGNNIINESGNVITIGASGDTITVPAGATLSVQGTYNQSGASNFTGAFTITTTDNSTTLELISTDEDANVGPRLSLYRNSASPADNDILGDIRFMAEDDASAKLEFAKIEAQALDVSDGSRDSQLRFQIRHANSGNDILKLNPTEAVFNDGSFNTDFRVESNDNANMLFVDASANTVGIGTSSPNSITNLHVADTYANEPMIRIETSDGGNKRLDLYVSSGQGYVTSTQSAQSLNFASRENLIFKTDTSNERARIDASGNLLVGTTSVQGGTAKTLQIADSSSPRLLLQNTGGGRTYGFFAPTNGEFGLFDYSASATRLTLNTSGTLLVGKTNQTANVSGTEIEGSGTIVSTRASNTNVFLNRTGNHGDIIELRKDNTQVGRIGSHSGKLYVSSGGNSGLKFRDDLNCIMPCGTDGGNSDGDQDLGEQGVRFRRLYLSEGIRLGGTGSANNLDDYEEGTFTPLFTSGGGGTASSYGNQTGRYTKIGRLVYIALRVTLSNKSGLNSGAVSVGGLPFNSNSGNAGRLGVLSGDIGNITSFGLGDMGGSYLGPNSTAISLMDNSQTAVLVSDLNNNSTVDLQMTYEAS